MIAFLGILKVLVEKDMRMVVEPVKGTDTLNIKLIKEESGESGGRKMQECFEVTAEGYNYSEKVIVDLVMLKIDELEIRWQEGA